MRIIIHGKKKYSVGQVVSGLSYARNGKELGPVEILKIISSNDVVAIYEVRWAG